MSGPPRRPAAVPARLAAGLGAVALLVFVLAAAGVFGPAEPTVQTVAAPPPTATMAATGAVAGAADPAPTTEPCSFVLELRALRDAVGADVVGGCAEHERFDAATGDRLQRTAGGLLVWRDETRTAAFTDGHRTWVHGPYGFQRRRRRERFDWELTATALGAPVVLSAAREPARVAGAVDGDTLAIDAGGDAERVSLLGIDAPELPTDDEPSCLAEVATAQLGALAPVGAAVALEPDPGLDARDDEGRRQLYVWLGDGRLLNRELIRVGLAVAADDGGRSRFGLLLRAAERRAREAGDGLWSPVACGPASDPPV